MEPSYLRDPFFPICKAICPTWQQGSAAMLDPQCLATCSSVMTQAANSDEGLQMLVTAIQQAQQGQQGGQQGQPPAAGMDNLATMAQTHHKGMGVGMAKMAHSPRGGMKKM